MADGGSWRDIWRGASRGFDRAVRLAAVFWAHPHFALVRPLPFLRHVWAWGHGDQRASWVCHGMICWTAAMVGEHVFDGRGRLVAGVMAAIYVLREIGDMWFHRRVAKDVDREDEDVDWQGRKKLGVTPLYDGFADAWVPCAVFLGSLI